MISGEGLGIMVGRGTGVDDESLRKKKEAIEKGIDINKPDPKDGLDVLAKVGGFEIGGIAGVLLAGALAMSIIEAAGRVVREVFTFDEAGVPGKP